MNGLKKLICLLMTIVAVGFAASASAAPTKKFSIAVSPSAVSIGSVKLTLTLKNETPNGNSNINSLRVNLPAGYSVDVANHNPPATSGYTGTLSWVTGSGGSVSMTNMSPLKPQSSFTITLWANVGSSAVCGTPATWTGSALTGSQLTGDSFLLVASTVPGASNTTTIAASPTLSFTTPPSDVVTGDPVNVSVQATRCGTPQSGVGLTVTVTDSAGATVATLNGTTGSDGTASFQIPLASVGSYTITAAATSDYPPITATVNVWGGVLNCQPTPPFSFTSDNGITDSSQEGYAAGLRGYWNKDGVSCSPLFYAFTNTILTDSTVHLAWDTSGGQHPAFTYSMTWKTEDVDNPANPATIGSANYGWPVPRRPFVAWQTSGAPIFVPAVACSGTELPAPYATLHDPIANAAATQIVVDAPPSVPAGYPTATFPTAASVSATNPFPIVIGTERMRVTGLSGAASPYTLTVTRGNGGTTAAPHLVNAYVMSTLLPLDLGTSVQVPMCVVNHGWMAAGVHNGIAQIRYFTTVFDIGDGWVTIR